MREIEFRGKRIDNNEWIYGWLRQSGHQEITKKNGQYVRTEKHYQIQNEKYNSQFIDETTVGQYTGLKDKNGMKIFEGDILQYDGGGIYIVVFDEMMIMCPHDNIEMPSPGYYGILIGDKTKELCPLGVTHGLAKIIGNIYDNPELLKEEP